MFGKNRILKPENHSGESLAIQEIFSTIQGEGIFVGQPAIFIRLGGCNLACDFCDTEFDSFTKISVDEIVASTEKLAKNFCGQIIKKLVVITGGEPMRQPIERLCRELLLRDFKVQIETNGTIFRDLPQEVHIVCSPKVSNGKYHKIRSDLLMRISAFKFLISESNQDYRDIGDVGQNQCNAQIYVQPLDEYEQNKNLANRNRAVKLCLEHGYFLSLQIHKILDIR